MGNIIKIKHGASVPTTTELPNGYELGFSTSTDCLYINNGTSISRIGIKVLNGTTAPTSGVGQEGDIYIEYSGSGSSATISAVYIKLFNTWMPLPSGGSLPQAEGVSF